MKGVSKFYGHSVFLLPFRICFALLVYFVVILVYSSRFGMLYQEKSGNPGWATYMLVDYFTNSSRHPDETLAYFHNRHIN
jgi:hypothetical protein